MATIGTYNVEGVNVDLYIPRKCHATNTLIASNDCSSVQIAIANVDANGLIDGTTTTLCITGYIRAQAESDHAINHLAIDRGIMRIKSAKPKKVAKRPQQTKGGKSAALVKGGKPQPTKGARPQPAKGGKPQPAKGGRQQPPRGGKSQAPRAPARK